MPRDLILGTAGHIDHGKTSLVRALTGIDCDRLPEEKARGITIDIGFAQLRLDPYHLGIVDVPGHERFIRNMLAGATGIDFALLVVAADDSIMPQTREHFEILQLLGLKQGVIALTKADLVDETTREVVALEIREMVAGSFLENAPIIETSAQSGTGLDELKAALRSACAAIEPRIEQEPFRLAIDRAFVVQGHGTIVTGSVTSGSVRVGDELEWHRGAGQTGIVRVRALNHHNESVQESGRGRRTAINLAGVTLDSVRRGQELATPGYLLPSRVLTVRVHALAGTRRPIPHRHPVRLHIGTAEVMAKVSILDADQIAPDEWAVAQLFLEEPVTAVWGQPFVLRDASAEHTLAGGQVLQPVAVKLRRRHIESLEHIEQLRSDSVEIRAETYAWVAAFRGFTEIDLVRNVGIPSSTVTSLIVELIAAGRIVELNLPPARRFLLHADRLQELGERIRTSLGELHEQNPLMTNHDRQKTLARLDYIGDEALLQVVTDQLVNEKKLIGDHRRIARVDFKPKLSANQRKLKDKIVEEYRQSGFQPPEPSGFIHQAAGNASALHDIFEVAVAEGYLVRITGEIYLHSDAEAEMRTRVTERLSSGIGATVAEIRDLLQTTRKYAVPFCEYLDRIGLTKREGDLRVGNG